MTDISFDLLSVASGLKLGDDGIWYAADQEAVSYPSEGNDQCFEIEDKSFWFQHRNACIVELVKRFPPRGSGPIFDVGGGNGFVAKGLMDAGWEVVLVEPGPAGARNAKKRGLQNIVCATTQSAGFKPGSMPAVGVFDVVEHIKDDVAFLKHLHGLLEPGGMLYLTVPAYNFLWSHEDVHACHFRRYTMRTLEAAVQSAGFKVAFMSGIILWLLVPIFVFRSCRFRLRCCAAFAPSLEQAKSDHALPTWLGAWSNRFQRWELSRIGKAQRVCFGASLISCVVRERPAA